MTSDDPAPGDSRDAYRKTRRFPYAIVIPIAFVIVVAVIVIVVLSFSHGAVSPPAPISGTPSITVGGGTPGQDR